MTVSMRFWAFATYEANKKKNPPPVRQGRPWTCACEYAEDLQLQNWGRWEHWTRNDEV